MSALTHLTETFTKMIQIGHRELYLENDYLHVSSEISPAYHLIGMTVYRPHSAIVLDSLLETHPVTCDSTAVVIKVLVLLTAFLYIFVISCYQYLANLKTSVFGLST